MMFRKHKRPEEKQAMALAKGDMVMGPKGQKWRVESVVHKNEMRDFHVTVKTEDGKRVLKMDWKDMVPMWKKPIDKKWRYSFLLWLGKKIGAPVRRV